MKNKKKMQEAMEEIVKIKAQMATLNAKLKNAYFDYYLAQGITADQADKLAN